MKIKVLLAIVAVGLAGSAFLISGEKDQAAFVPREFQQASQSAKGAAEIMKRLRSNLETGNFEPEDYLKLFKAYNKMVPTKNLDMTWEQMGPNNVGGRTRAILIVDNNTLYCGAVSGGLWKSTDGANNWTQVETFPACPISAIDRTGNGTIYVATGTSYDSGGAGNGGSGFPGAGLFKSSDGVNWELVEGTEPNFLNPGDWSYIDELAPDPNRSDRIWIAMTDGLGYYDESTNTLYDPEGNALDGLPTNTQCQDVQISSDGSVMVASIGSGDAYRSLDGGSNWDPMFANNDPAKLPQSGVGRLELAISPSNANYIYALGATTGGSMAGGWYSSDKGATWSQGWPGQVDAIDLFGSNSQGIYDNIITVDPTNPTRALAGGVTLWQFGTGQEPEQIAFNFGFPGFNLYVHSDIHEFKWAPNGDLYIGTDGGVFKSVDGGETFIEANRGFITTQFYGIAHNSGDGALGGTQDNGTIYIPNDGSLSNDMNGTSVFGGDGFDCDFSQISVPGYGTAFVTSQFGALSRFTESGSGGEFYDNTLLNLIGEDGEIGGFYTTIRHFENTEDELSQQNIIVVNPFGKDTTSTAEVPIVLTLNTNNLDIPFQYTLPEGTTLEFYDQIIRPEFFADQPVLEDPTYFWLDPQVIEQVILCDEEEILVGTETQDSIIYITEEVVWDTTILVNNQEVVLTDTISYTYPVDTVEIEVPVFETELICDTTYHHFADTLENIAGRLLVQDQFTSMFAIGFNGNLGLWLTRQALDFNTTPEWWNIVPSVNGEVKCIEFDADGKHMFFGTWGGRVYRVSNLQNLWDEDDIENLTITEVYNSGGATVTGIAIDPNDADHVVVTLGNYGGSGKVRESFNATSNNPTFNNIWNPGNNAFLGMPVYDAVIDVTDGDKIIIGTEFGIWATDDGGDTWEPANGGDMDPCPVFAVRQQSISGKRFINPNNYGVVYAGTHGRGIFRSESVVSVNDVAVADNTSVLGFTVFPNPASEQISFELNMTSMSDINIEVYSINGQLVKTLRRTNIPAGKQTITFPVSELSEGNYIARISGVGVNKIAKFIVNR
jgi:hypothetical protein